MSVLTDFFMPNQNLKPDFRYLIRFLQGCHFAMFGNLTWQPCKHSLDHISDTIHPISKFLFCKINYFFHTESDSDSQMSISVTNFAGLPDSAFPPGNPRKTCQTISQSPSKGCQVEIWQPCKILNRK